MRKKIGIKFDGGDSGSKKCKRGYGGIWWSLHLAGIWSQAVGFVLEHFAELREMFSHLIDFIMKFYKCFTFGAICEHNAAINDTK
jgi:hypothetical protein